MNKQESQNLMIGSWVLAGGEPRQVSSLTTKKAEAQGGTAATGLEKKEEAKKGEVMPETELPF